MWDPCRSRCGERMGVVCVECIEDGYVCICACTDVSFSSTLQKDIEGRPEKDIHRNAR